MADFDSIYEDQDENSSILEAPNISMTPEPVVIRGAGNITVFGLSNRFDTDFPNLLHSRVAPEKFKTRHQLEKQLDWENCHLYSKLGLKWKLARQRCDSSLMMEHVLLVEFVPKQNLFKPD